MEKLEVEPLSSECSSNYLQSKLGKRKKAPRECPFNQSVIAGIGNIYSNEIVFQARIRPTLQAA
ncbi:hypothetical protein [Eubacterium sp. 14-2]|uniref:hypothetical protein n=1 Tax=Eubacterium sp. 14-2 TaxID=1235790 RepID=UPI0009DBC80A